MFRHRTRRLPLLVEVLETRQLLTAALPLALWLGQDGHDHAGGPSAGAGNGIQDMHFLLENLPISVSVTGVRVMGYGGGEWDVNLGPYSPFNGFLTQTKGAATADLYLDPYQVETGRQFDITLDFSNGSSTELWVQGGAADPNLWMPSYNVNPSWIGQDGHDLTGQGPAVGPDGFQDIHLALANLNQASSVSSVTVTSGSLGWSSGLNPNVLTNAEFVLNSSDPTRGDLYFSPTTNLNGQTLSVTVAYADGKLDTTTLKAGPTNPSLAEPGPSPVAINWTTLSGSWLGQDGLNLVGPGDVHVSASGIPSGRTVVSATLSDEAGIDWTYLAPGFGLTAADPDAQPLGLVASSNHLDLSFAPVRSEAGSVLTLLVRLDNGSLLATHLSGGFADPGLREPQPAATSVVAHPGDDLNALANEYGVVHLTAGIYEMDQPLVLASPVDLVAAPGVTLLFSQPASQPSWTTAIKVMASHTTLNGFAVRFAGPIRWNTTIGYGPAVVGTTDSADRYSPDPRIDETFTHLDLAAPPASSSWEQAPELFRMTNAESGSIVGNTLKGGESVLFNGPWQVSGNTYLGTMPGTFAYDAFATHSTHDVQFVGNLIAPTASSGKTWRFLVMTQQGIGDSVVNNAVRNVGPKDSDTIPNPNATEIILTEAYRLHYEGVVSSVSANGLVVQIPSPQGGPARTGDVLSILSGPQAGQWRMIAQVIDASTYVLDAPITPGSFAVSLSTGFVNETYQGNVIDDRGSSVADALVLPGNQFGAKVLNNVFIGGDNAFQISSDPTESPDIWGWSHVPFLGATISENTLEDVLNGGTIDVAHNPYIKTDVGRVYFSGTFTNNSAVWDSGFPKSQTTSSLLTVGNTLSADPNELVISLSGNTVQGPASIIGSATLEVLAANVNGHSERNVNVILPPPSASASKPAAPAPTVTVTVPSQPILAPASAPAPAPIVASPPPSLAPVLAALTSSTSRPVRQPLRSKLLHEAAVLRSQLVQQRHRLAAAATQARIRTQNTLIAARRALARGR